VKIIDYPTARTKLKRVLARRDDKGLKTVVPIIGTGMNIEAGVKDNWDILLGKIRRYLNIRKNAPSPPSQLAKWEVYLRHLARKDDLQAHVAEKKLQREVAHVLRDATLNNRGLPLYVNLLNGNFRDIINLNFDLSLDRSATNLKFRQWPKSEKQGMHNAPLYRWYDAYTGDNPTPTRIWHPHGDVQRIDTIKLGTRLYGMYIKEIEFARKEMMGIAGLFDRDNPDHRDAVFVQTQDWIFADMYTTWLAVLCNAPVVIIGAGLSTDEWPLWWALHERARYQNRLKSKQPTYFLTEAEGTSCLPTHLQGLPAMIEVLPFQSNSEIWELLVS
jgi:hypothetical protein